MKRSRQRRRYNPKLRRLLKRKTHISAPDGEDWPFLWAAYTSGCLDPHFESGLSLDAFKEQFMIAEERLPDLYVARCMPKDGTQIPVGLIASFNGGEHPTWHAVWFPWAKSRQILECAAKFLHLMRNAGTMGFVQTDHGKPLPPGFAPYLVELGLLRKVGDVLHYYGLNEHMHLYQQTVKR